MFDAIKSGILEVPFQRKHLRIRYQILEEISGSDGNDYIALQLCVEYKVKNIATNIRTYFVSADIEKPPLDQFESLERITSATVNYVPLTEAQLTAGHRRAEDTKAFIRFSHPIDLEPDEEQDVVLIFNSIKRRHDHEVLTVLQPTESMQVILDFDRSKFDVEAYALHFRDLDVMPGGWSIRGVLLPYQGMNIAWRPKASRDSA